MSAGRRRPEFSQHFLRSSELAARLVAYVDPRPGDLVVEVGPGRGVLTAALAATGARVVAVEVDPALAAATRERFAGHVEVVTGDFLHYVVPADARVVANLPFSITAEAIRHITRASARDAHLVLQREAALNLAGAPYGPETLRSMSLKPWWHLEVLGSLSAHEFVPPPAVDASYVWLSRRSPPLVTGDGEAYRRFLADTFGRTRTLRHALRTRFTPAQVERLGRDLALRLGEPPSATEFDRWLALYRASVWLNPTRTPPAGSPASRSRRGRRAGRSRA